jgi:hypothetical protein
MLRETDRGASNLFYNQNKLHVGSKFLLACTLEEKLQKIPLI